MFNVYIHLYRSQSQYCYNGYVYIYNLLDIYLFIYFIYIYISIYGEREGESLYAVQSHALLSVSNLSTNISYDTARFSLWHCKFHQKCKNVLYMYPHIFLILRFSCFRNIIDLFSIRGLLGHIKCAHPCRMGQLCCISDNILARSLG